MGYHGFFIPFLLILLSQFHSSSASWFFSSDRVNTPDSTPSKHVVSEFSMEALHDRKAVQLIENAKSKMLAPTTCWQTAYRNVFEGCAKTLADEESRSRLAWHLSDCFQQHTGRESFPHCDEKSEMKKCLRNLDRDAHKVYLEYFIETNSICHQLQIEAFTRQTERLVNELKISAEYAEMKLSQIDEHGKQLLQNSREIHESLFSIDSQTQEVAKTSRMVEERVNSVLKHSKEVYEQSKEIAASQVELREGQDKMKESLAEGMWLIQNGYENLGMEILNLRNEAIEIEKEIGKVGDAMAAKIKVLQSKADKIREIAGASLDKQKELLDGQFVALEGLQFLTKFQSQALEESRITMKDLVKLGQKQKEELLEKHTQLHQSHDHLMENSNRIIEAQDVFKSKQETMFLALDKLFALLSTMLFESRVVITSFLYSLAIFLIFVLTSTKHTYIIRQRLYLGLFVTFPIEVITMWCIPEDKELQGRIIHIVRLLFLLQATTQYLYAIFTYRDYETLNHNMLLMLMEKVNSMQGKKELLPWDVDADSEVDWSSWVDEELPEEVDLSEDPDYLFPEEDEYDSSSGTSSSSKKYNLRRRR